MGDIVAASRTACLFRPDNAATHNRW